MALTRSSCMELASPIRQQLLCLQQLDSDHRLAAPVIFSPRTKVARNLKQAAISTKSMST